MNDDHEHVIRNYEAARKRIHAALPTAMGGQSAEVAYAEAAAAMVKAGLHRPLKRKYRMA